MLRTFTRVACRAASLASRAEQPGSLLLLPCRAPLGHARGFLASTSLLAAEVQADAAEVHSVSRIRDVAIIAHGA
jgi:hypothetical protein